MSFPSVENGDVKTSRYTPLSSQMSAEIESAIDAEDWDGARSLIEVALESEPYNHWLITRLGLTYYEQYDYQLSFKYARAALKIAPTCPLARWDCAGALDMLKRHGEAIPHYKQMIDAGDAAIANDTCGEGLDWARSLIADCHFRLGDCHRKSGHFDAAVGQYERYLELRQQGWGSIYDQSDAHIHIADCR